MMSCAKSCKVHFSNPQKWYTCPLHQVLPKDKACSTCSPSHMKIYKNNPAAPFSVSFTPYTTWMAHFKAHPNGRSQQGRPPHAGDMAQHQLEKATLNGSGPQWPIWLAGWSLSRAQYMVHHRICMYFWDLIEWSGGGVLGSAFWSLHPKVWLLKDCVANYCTWRVRYSPALTPEVHTELWETKKPAPWLWHWVPTWWLLGIMVYGILFSLLTGAAIEIWVRCGTSVMLSESSCNSCQNHPDLQALQFVDACFEF